MDWKVIAATFGLVFVAELGDKTQLVVLARAAGTGKLLPVFLGAAAAMVLCTLIGVLVGSAVGKLPDRLIKGVAGALFVGIGIWTLWGVWK